MNYSLILRLLLGMDYKLVKDPIHPYHWLCICLTATRVENRTPKDIPEVFWIATRIRKVTVGHLSVESALQALRPGIKVTPDEAYELRKYLIRRWLSEAKMLNESASPRASFQSADQAHSLDKQQATS